MKKHLSLALATAVLVLSSLTGCATTEHMERTPEDAFVMQMRCREHSYRECGRLPMHDSWSPTAREINGTFAQYFERVNAGDGVGAATSLRRFFPILRTACTTGEMECRSACDRRYEMNTLRMDWNDRVTHRFPVRHGQWGTNIVINIGWEEDVDIICSNHNFY